MRPSGHRYVSKRLRGNRRSKFGHVKLVTVDCPSGTVPIRRVTKDELIRTNLNQKRHALTHGVLADEEKPTVRYAIARTKFVQSGTDSIEVGTQTNPTIYNDLVTRIFVRTTTSYMDKFNLQPSIPTGFVQVLEGHPIDMEVAPVSERGVRMAGLLFSIKVDEHTGYWWFYLNDGPKQLTMGFWAPSFSGGMDGLATGVDWSGEVSGPYGVPSAPMGSGHCPEIDTKLDAYCALMKVVDDPGKQEIDVVDIETYRDTHFYNVLDRDYVNPTSGHVMLFGGPGRNGKSCDGN